jgi:WD40 repeat protein
MANISGITTEEIAHLEELCGVLRRRLRLLDMQLAKIAGNPSASAQVMFEREECERQLASALAELRRLRPNLVSDRSPYLGLLTFQEANADLFFGRDVLIADLVERVRRAPFLAVLGASGSGKSSVVRAGLISILKGGALPGSESWRYITMKPGVRPLDTLAVELAKLQSTDLSQALALSQQLAESDRAFLLAIDLLLDRAAGQRLVLVVDQFEELWTQAPLEESARATFVSQQQQPFIERLLSALSAPDTPLIIILTMRLDFLHRVASHHALAHVIGEHDVIVSPMSPAELREVILRPVELVGGDFEPGLVDELVEQGQRGALPLLEYTLAELWKQRQPNGVMTWQAYRELGGVEGALAARADALLGERYNPEQQNELRQVLLRLVQPGEGVADTRRRVRLDELVLAGKSFEELYHLLKPLIDERLLTSGRDETDGEETIEVSHEELIRAWPTFERWINEARADLRFQLRLEEAAQDWEANNRNSELLWSGLRLSNAEAWLERAQPHLNARDQAFIDASRAAERARIEAEEAARQRELAQAQALAEEQRLRAEEQQRRAEEQAAASRRLRLQAIFLAATLVVALIAALGAGWFGVAAKRSAEAEQLQRATAEAASQRAEREATTSLARQLAAQAERDATIRPEQALLLSLQANRFVDERQTRGALHNVLLANGPLVSFIKGHSATVTNVVFSPDGNILASTSEDLTIRFWDVSTQRPLSEPLQLDDIPAFSIAFSPDGKILASGHGDAGIQLWDVETQQPLGEPLLGHMGPVISVAFNPDGTILASASFDGSIRLWDVATRQPLGEPLQSPDNVIVYAMAFSPDGTIIASANFDNTIQLWDVATRQPLGEGLQGHAETIRRLAFSPDGTILASVSDDASILLWDVATWQPLGEGLQGETGAVWGLTFSPDGSVLASSSGNAAIQLWDVATWQPLGTLPMVNSGDIWSLAFSPDGKFLATASNDAIIRLWDMTSIQPLQAHTDLVTDVAFSPDGKLLASASGDTTIQLWDAVTRQPLGEPLRGHTDIVWDMAFSPDGSMLASVSDDATIRLWDVATRQPLGEPLRGHTGYSKSLAFSPDGTILAAIYEDATIRLWDVASRQPLGEPLQGHTSFIWYIAFSPDGRILASTSDDSSIRLWDVATRQPLGELIAVDTAARNVTFSPDGATLAIVDGDRAIQLWDVASRQLLGEPLRGHTDPISSIAFSPDGTMLVSSSWDGSIWLWDVVSRQPLGDPIRGHTDGVTNVAFSPDSRVLASSNADGTIRLWDVDLKSWIERACRMVGRNLSQNEWEILIGPERPYERTCPMFPPGEGAFEGVPNSE